MEARQRPSSSPRRGRARWVRHLCAAALLAILAIPLEAEILRVDGLSGADSPTCGSESSPCATIQQAVDLASSGDTILVAESVYTGSSSCLGEQAVVCVLHKQITLLGGYATDEWSVPSPSTNTTIIDGQHTRRGILVFRSGPDPNLPATSLVLQGFTVRNGYADGNPNAVGGGLKANFASVTLRDTVFEGNTVVAGTNGLAGGGGAAILSDADNIVDVVVERSRFEDNRAEGGDTGGPAIGGGLLVDHATFTGLDLDFLSNDVVGGSSVATIRDGLGGGLALSFGVIATIRDLTAVGNSATGGSAGNPGGSAFGGGVFVEGAEAPAGNATVVELTDSVMSGNTSTGGDAPTAGCGVGGAIDTIGSQLVLERTVVTSNHAFGGTGNEGVKGCAGGGGIYLEWPFDSESPIHELTNVVVADNTSTGSQGGGSGLRLLGVRATATHVTFVDNRLIGPGFGPGILVGPRPPSRPSDLTLSWSILADHTSPSSGHALYVQAIPPTGSTADVTETNHFVGNSNDTNAGGPGAGTFIGFPGTNIRDPSPSTFFVDPTSSDYHVDGTAPPTDSATGSSESLDLDGAARNGVRDLGADEFGVSAHLLAAGRLGAGSGSVTSDPGGIDCGVDCSELFPTDTVVDLDATPTAGSYFAGWEGDLDCVDGTVSMSQPRSCRARFALGSSPCTISTESLVLTDQEITTAVAEEACVSITAGPSYTIADEGEATFVAPTIVLRHGFVVRGSFTAVNAVP